MQITFVPIILLVSCLAVVHGILQTHAVVQHGDHLDVVNRVTGEATPVAPIAPILPPLSPLLNLLQASITPRLPIRTHDLVPHGDHVDAVNRVTGEATPVAPLGPLSKPVPPISQTKTTIVNHGDHDHIVTDTVAPKQTIPPIGGILPILGCQNRLGRRCPHPDDYCVRERGPHDDPYYDLCHRGDPYRCTCMEGCVYSGIFIPHRSSEVLGRRGCRRCYCFHGQVSCERRRGRRCQRGRGRRRSWLE